MYILSMYFSDFAELQKKEVDNRFQIAYFALKRLI